MLRSFPTSAVCQPHGGLLARALRSPSVCVVDPQAGDYDSWKSLADDEGVRLHFAATADEALRLARCERVDLWVVNSALPGLGGAELCGMLQSQARPGAVYLVADEYSPDTEQAAWKARATLFLCKPAHREVLSEWLERARGVPTSVTTRPQTSNL